MTLLAGRAALLALLIVTGACSGAEDDFAEYHEADTQVVSAGSPEERLSIIRQHFEAGDRKKISMRLLDQAVAPRYSFLRPRARSSSIMSSGILC